MTVPTDNRVTPAMLLDAAGWCQSEDELRETLRLAAKALSAALAVEAGADAEWTYKIQYGPDGEANYAWVYRGQEMVATMKTHHANALCSALTTSPASSGVEGEAVASERQFLALEARRYASHYPEASDGRNTFVLFAEMIEARALPASPAPHQEGRADG